MKNQLFSLLLAAMLVVSAMTGCQAREASQKVASVGDTLKKSVETTSAAGSSRPATLTMEEAQSIALKHAGLSADQVTALHTEYDIEHGIPQFDVEFHHGNWEYDYEIHADTGEILSFSKED